MIIITTPMCEKILKFCQIDDYKVNKNPDLEEGELNILMSEKKSERMSLVLKLNTFNQIKESIEKVGKYSDNPKFLEDIDEKIANIFSNYKIANKWTDDNEKEEFKKFNSKIKVKVYSKFLEDIIKDMGFKIAINNDDTDFIVYPDYLDVDKIAKSEENKENQKNKLIEIPSHSNVSKDPIERTEYRYSLIEEKIQNSY
ncbi:hypothetical protein MBFIL_00420 [Methanobrevibacter filiformis]|uniref:Segregation and condensation protein B n=1 Tax=Methanobrevibacter filiformis TaxID=55758 RepID=A0A166FF47_9EURY|nr:hypothetical protein MBFIL_00420 [Methanobrevibacter filiformis]